MHIYRVRGAIARGLMGQSSYCWRKAEIGCCVGISARREQASTLKTAHHPVTYGEHRHFQPTPEAFALASGQSAAQTDWEVSHRRFIRMNASILDYLKINGERLEAEIAKEMRLPMALVQSHLLQLSSTGEVICCKLTRYLDGKKIEGTSWRLSLARTGKPYAPAKPKGR